jgi:hypothetical protein
MVSLSFTDSIHVPISTELLWYRSASVHQMFGTIPHTNLIREWARMAQCTAVHKHFGYNLSATCVFGTLDFKCVQDGYHNCKQTLLGNVHPRASPPPKPKDILAWIGCVGSQRPGQIVVLSEVPLRHEYRRFRESSWVVAETPSNTISKV